MQIAIFHNLPSGGGKRALFEWIRRLAKAHSIHVYTLSTADHDFCDIRPFVQKYHIYNFEPRRNFKSPLGRLNQFQRWLDLRSLDYLQSLIAQEVDLCGYDIVFANTCSFTFIPALIKYLQTRTIYYLHEPFGLNYVRSFDRPYHQRNSLREGMNKYDPFIKVYRRKLNTLQRSSIEKTTCLLANSQFTKDVIKREFSAESEVCPLGVDFQNFFPTPEMEKENAVISVGELSPRKGFDFVIKSIAKIPLSQRPTLFLACNSYRDEEKKYIVNLAQEENVMLQIFEALNTDQLRKLYNKSLLCVYTPLLEPFGLVPLESMACGTPVVGIDEGGVKESVINGLNGMLIERNEEKFASAIQDLLQNPNLIKQYGMNSRKYVEENWSWDKSTKILEGYFNQITESKRIAKQQ